MDATQMDLTTANLAAFVVATSGHRGTVDTIPGGVVVASPVAVANGYVNAAFRTTSEVPATTFLAGSRAFFDGIGHPHVVWVPTGDIDLLAAAEAAGGTLDGPDTPAMSRTIPVSQPTDLRVRRVGSEEDRLTFGRLCEEGYAQPGLAWLLDHHGSYDVPDLAWVIATDGTGDRGVGCGYLDGTTAGIYYVATPPEHRGRGAAAAVTSWLVDHLLESGADRVTLQASDDGFPIYARLGFDAIGSYRRFTFDSPA
jgi:GNAT superfamily N-acetyltransferase